METSANIDTSASIETSAGKHNAHVLMYIRFMHWLSIKYSKPISQLHYYTLYQQELDPNWKPEHMRRDTMPDN
jgi:hypothetical protein